MMDEDIVVFNVRINRRFRFVHYAEPNRHIPVFNELHDGVIQRYADNHRLLFARRHFADLFGARREIRDLPDFRFDFHIAKRISADIFNRDRSDAAGVIIRFTRGKDIRDRSSRYLDKRLLARKLASRTIKGDVIVR